MDVSSITLEELYRKQLELASRQEEVEAKLSLVTEDVTSIRDDFTELKAEFNNLSREVIKMMGIVQSSWQSIISQNSRLVDSMADFQKTTIEHNQRVEKVQQEQANIQANFTQQQAWSVATKVFGAGGILGAGGIVGVIISQYI